MYSNPAAAAAGGGVQTFNSTVASSDASAHQIPVHSLPANNQQYYSLQAQPQISAIAPGAPASAQMTGYGQQYNVAGGQGYQAPQPQTVPGAPAGYQQAPTQMYMPASAQPGTAAAEYQPYNMHGTGSLIM